MVQFFQGSVQGAVIEVVQDGVPLGEGAALAVLAGQAHGMVFREQAAPCQGFRHGPVQQAAFPEGFPAAGQEAFFQRGVGREAVRKFRKDTSDALEQFRTDSRPRADAREGRFIRILRGGGQDVVRGVFLHLQVGLFHALPKVFPDVLLLLFRQFPALPERHSVQGGGVIVDGGKFDWAASGKFPDFTEPDESYHGVVYTREFGAMAYIIKARMQLMRDFGCYPAAHSAFLLNLGLETLPVRMRQYCENALTVAKFLESSDKIASVRYPALPGNEHYERAQKYLPMGTSGVMSIDIKGGRAPAMKFMDSLKLACNEVHVADIRTCVLHPASETHRQLTDEQLVAAGIEPGMVRISVGLENVEDIIADLEQALNQI